MVGDTDHGPVEDRCLLHAGEQSGPAQAPPAAPL